MRSNAQSDTGASSQLAFQIINSAGGTTAENVIYVTSDATYNKASLQITLTSGKTILSPGAIPDPATPPGPGTGTTLYVDLSGLQLSAGVWKSMTFDGAGWKFKAFPDEGVLGMTPDGDSIALSSGTAGAITIGINGLMVPAPPSTPTVQVYVEYFNVPDVAGQYSTFAVAVMNAPDAGGDLAEAIGVSLSANGIVNTADPLLTAANQFALQFTNRQRTVKAGTDTLFTVTFVYGAPHDQYGYGALTDVTRANAFSVTAGDNTEGWTITPDSNAQAVTWTLQPQSGAPIVGTGAQSVVTVNFANVVTTYQAGPTVMLISYSGVPGYKDGTFTLVLNKIQHVSIGSLSVAPSPTYFSGGSAKVTVSWQATGAQSLELTQNYSPISVTGKTELAATLDAELTTFALKAVGRPGTVDNSDFKTVQAVALPVINSFAGAPSEIFYGSASHEASFDWAVDSTDDVTLSSTADAFGGQSYSPVGHASATITESQMVTLAPTTAANPLTLTRRLVISGFKPAPKNYQLPFTPSAVAVSPSGPFVLVAGPSTSLTVLDTIQYATGQTFGLGHTATAMAFSADGTTLATANSDKTVSVVDVTAGPDGMPVFGSPHDITLGGVPQQLVFSPAGPRIFVTVDPGGTGPGQVVSLLKGSGGWAIEGQPVTVGAKPRGLGMDAAGARLFVANSGDTTVTLVGVTTAGKLSGTTDIHGFTGGPLGIAATPSGKQLLVTCGSTAGAGSVVAIDPNRPDTGQRNSLLIGRGPGQIALLPSGSYGIIPNADDGTVSLVDCWGQPASARLAGPPVAVGQNPRAIAASPDGLQVLLAVDNGLCVMTLSTYEVSASAPSIPNQPTSVAVSPDGSNVFAWHDAQIPARPQSPGILVYATRSRTVSNLLADKNVLRFVASPDTRSAEAFAIVASDPALYRISLETLDTNTYSLGLAAGNLPVALAISGEGQTLYVVASDSSRNLTLVVLRMQGGVWSTAQTLPLYKAGVAGRFLLRPTPDGTTMFLVDVSAAQVRVLRRSGERYTLVPTVIPADVKAMDLAVLPDGSRAYVLNAGSQTNTITVVDVVSLSAHTDAIPQQYVNLTGLQPSPDGRRLFATDTNAAALRVLDPASLRILQTIPLSAKQGGVTGVQGLAVMPDGSAIYTANMLTQNMSVVEQVQIGAALTAPRARVSSPLAAYNGLFMRHYLGEKPGDPPSGWSASPDVWPYGQAIEPDRTKFTTPEGYAKDWGTVVKTGGTNNYVYVRGMNPGAADITSRVYFYYTRGSLAMWPANWQSDYTTVNKETRNWVDVTAPANGGVGVCDVPLLWTPPNLPPGTDHYCIIGWAVDGPDPQPPDFAHYSQFTTFDDLVYFIQSHHNMAWRNTVDVVTPPPNYSYNTALSMPDAGGTVYLTVTFKDIPPDGTFAVNVAGTDPSNSVALPPSSLANYQGGFTPRNNPLIFPSKFDTSVQVQYWEGLTKRPDTAQIKVSLLVQTGPAMLADVERQARLAGRASPIRSYGSIPVIVVGTVQYNLLFGTLAAK